MCRVYTFLYPNGYLVDSVSLVSLHYSESNLGYPPTPPLPPAYAYDGYGMYAMHMPLCPYAPMRTLLSYLRQKKKPHDRGSFVGVCAALY